MPVPPSPDHDTQPRTTLNEKTRASDGAGWEERRSARVGYRLRGAKEPSSRGKLEGKTERTGGTVERVGGLDFEDGVARARPACRPDSGHCHPAQANNA